MAAGNASRFGKPKQLEAVGPAGECLMEFSLYTASKLGFSQVVIVTNSALKNLVEARFEPIAQICGMELQVVVQSIALDGSAHAYRKKPWGTGHALLTAAPYVDSTFVLLNADDFYGRESLERAADFLRGNTEIQKHALIAYPIANTIIPGRKYARAICETKDRNILERLVEFTAVCMEESGKIMASAHGQIVEIAPKKLCSINCWAFKPGIFELLAKEFSDFLQTHQALENAEFFLPSAIESLIMHHHIDVEVFESQSTWFGLTFQEDLTEVRAQINQLIQKGFYPDSLWKKL